MSIPRSKIPSTDKWNIEALYPSFDEWNVDFQRQCPERERPRWLDLLALKGRLAESTVIFKTCFELWISRSRALHRLRTYARLRHDEDINENAQKVAYEKIVSYIHDFDKEISWIRHEIFELKEATLQAYLVAPEIAEYRFLIEKIVRLRQYTLSTEKEELVVMARKALQAPRKVFKAIHDADFKFPNILDSQGKSYKLSRAVYGSYLRDSDRILRKNAFKAFLGKYCEHENFLCELISGHIQAHLFHARSHGYGTCLDAALYPKNIDTELYHSLIKSVRDNIGVLHKYMKLRKQLLKLDDMHLYDLHVPLIPYEKSKISYDEAVDLIITSVAPLGSDYQNILLKGLREERWVDRYSNQNKRPSAYSSSFYDSMPYILMNYTGSLGDVITLAHEAGHSMHSYMSHRYQPYQYGGYPIFLGEVSSTFNEVLLWRLLIQRAKDKAERLYLINEEIAYINNTLLCHTMLAEFELFLHRMAEKDIPLTPKLLKDYYRELNAFYFGTDVTLDSEIDIEWARISHFYDNFYVFQYATGLSASLALAERVSNGGEVERNAYLEFLKAGSSCYPVDILAHAGVDMRSSALAEAALRKMDALITDFETNYFS